MVTGPAVQRAGLPFCSGVDALPPVKRLAPKQQQQQHRHAHLPTRRPNPAQDAENTRILFRAVPDRRADRSRLNSQLFLATGKKQLGKQHNVALDTKARAMAARSFGAIWRHRGD